ncbi:MAG: hypothetical protein NTZ65_04355 [Candidatus Berkelbacteria bacterium]|nr:hypothetical protein [Candidatus Berkelbacteria bacterium]
MMRSNKPVFIQFALIALLVSSFAVSANPKSVNADSLIESKTLISSSGLDDNANWTKQNVDFNDPRDSTMLTKTDNGVDYNSTGSLNYKYSAGKTVKWTSADVDKLEPDHSEQDKIWGLGQESVANTVNYNNYRVIDTGLFEFNLDGSKQNKWQVGDLAWNGAKGIKNDYWVLNMDPETAAQNQSGGGPSFDPRHTTFDNTISHVVPDTDSVVTKPLPSGLQTDAGSRIVVDKLNRLWITESDLLYIIEGDSFDGSGSLNVIKIIALPTENNSFLGHSKMVFDDMDCDNLYILRYNVTIVNGVISPDSHTNVARIKINNLDTVDYDPIDNYQLSGIIASDIVRDKYNNIWIGSSSYKQNNVVRISYKTHERKFFTLSDPHNILDGTYLVDDQNRLIASGSQGAILWTQLTANDTENPVLGSIQLVESRSYDHSNLRNCYTINEDSDAAYGLNNSIADFDNNGNIWTSMRLGRWVGIDTMPSYNCIIKWDSSGSSIDNPTAFPGGYNAVSSDISNDIYRDASVFWSSQGSTITKSKYNTDSSVTINYSNQPIADANQGTTDISQVPESSDLYLKINLNGSQYLSPELKSLKVNYTQVASLSVALAAQYDIAYGPVTPWAKATVSSTETGPYTYTYYCNDKQSVKHENISTKTDQANNVCTFLNTGKIKVIASSQSGKTAQAEKSVIVSSISLSADPDSGVVPLNDVSLTAKATQSVPGQVFSYYFYCNRADDSTNIGNPDASFEKLSESTKIADKLCKYPSVGSYTAKVIITSTKSPPSQAKTGVTVVSQPSQPPTLVVSLKANPSSGGAPLGNVKLTATIDMTQSTAVGPATYVFNCRDDQTPPTPQETISVNYKSATTANPCQYNAKGTYHPMVTVTREGITNTADATVSATESDGGTIIFEEGGKAIEINGSIISDKVEFNSRIKGTQGYAVRIYTDSKILNTRLPGFEQLMQTLIGNP